MNVFWSQALSLLGNSIISNKASHIGSLGEVAFEVQGPRQVLTVDDFSRSASAKYSEHNIIGGKPVSEFCGPDLQSISFKIKIHAQWGQNPASQMKKLIEYCELGQVLDFILGNGPVGDNHWVIESVCEAVDHFGVDGNIVCCTASLSLKEYVGE